MLDGILGNEMDRPIHEHATDTHGATLANFALFDLVGKQLPTDPAHIWPTHHENVHFYGTHSVDIDGELAQLDTDGYRPLRVAGPGAAG